MGKLNCLWFSRHEPNEVQLEELTARGMQIVALEDGQKIGKIVITDNTDLKVVCDTLFTLGDANDANHIVGVFAAPMIEMIHRSARNAISLGKAPDDAMHCLQAWNVKRVSNDQMPIFEHYRFCAAGFISRSAMKWIK